MMIQVIVRNPDVPSGTLIKLEIYKIKKKIKNVILEILFKKPFLIEI